MTINITDKPEMNVVNVGDEISGDQLAAIQSATNPTAINPFATIADVGGGGGSYLPLAGGTMTGDITFGTAGQYIGEGNFDTSRGGVNGLSLVCSVGYEFNWQAGWLITTEQNSTIGRPLYLDGLAGTTLRVWDSNRDAGSELTPQSLSILAPITGEFHPAEIFIGEDVMNGGGVLTIYNQNINATARYGSSGIVYPDGSFQSTASPSTTAYTVYEAMPLDIIPHNLSNNDYVIGLTSATSGVVLVDNLNTGESAIVVCDPASTDSIEVNANSVGVFTIVWLGTTQTWVGIGQAVRVVMVNPVTGLVHVIPLN